MGSFASMNLSNFCMMVSGLYLFILSPKVILTYHYSIQKFCRTKESDSKVNKTDRAEFWRFFPSNFGDARKSCECVDSRAAIFPKTSSSNVIYCVSNLGMFIGASWENNGGAEILISGFLCILWFCMSSYTCNI